MKRLIVFAAVILAAVSAQASQKIVSFDPAYKGAIDKSIESVGGRVTKKFKLIDSLVAVFPGGLKDASIYSLKGVTNVDEDLYTKWIERCPP